MKSSFIQIIVISLFITGTPSIQAIAQVSNPNGNLQPLEADEIWAQTLSGGYFNEFWNYQFYFDNEVTVHITFSAANFGSLKSPVSGVRVSVHNLKGELYQLSREYPIERLVQDKEAYRFQLHPEREIFFEGKLPEQHRIRINTTKDGVTYDIDLKLDQIEEGFKLDDGQFTIGSEQIGIITHIPYAIASGYVSVDNNRENVQGTAYMDHTYQNQTTTRLMHSGYRFVYQNSAEDWDLLYFLLPSRTDNNQTIGYRLSSNEGNVSISGVERIKNIVKSKTFNHDVARLLEIELAGSDNTMRISRTDDQERFSVLGELGWVARRAARTFLGGEVIDFRGNAVLMEPGNRPKHGHYNFFLVD